ncbi:hypothetical protein CERSUDRAFT_58818 [Gelatoporia subvermispora B]|uniref:Uncharacterized protein n=1 Tax=Ceriporiopsis subvermispora (strain B) TaxID=914234 RepID=M2R208_CERS8|nr:hypothetical protein CERSUDRAFT_58818 [Gelatoporia subvermispora B]
MFARYSNIALRFSRRRPVSLSLAFGFGSFIGNSVRHSSSSTTFILRQPAPDAPREVPTPLVFVSSSAWDTSSSKGMPQLASLFSARGYTCLEIDLGLEESSADSQELMHKFDSEVSAHVRLAAIPFAPVIIARSGGTLIAQTYISSHPASGLILISPPASNADATSRSLLPAPLPEFNFEPKFPCAILCTEDEAATLADKNRLWQDTSVDKFVVRDEKAVNGQDGFNHIQTWLDDIGV